MPPSSTAYEVIGDPESVGPFVITCEHASNALPAYLIANETDQTLLNDHWGLDIGAADVTKALVEALGGQGILAKFSRLVVDLNRDPRSADLFLSEAEGKPVSFNRDLDDDEREARRDRFFAPYHEAIEDLLAARKALDPSPVTLLSVHSFTRVYRGHTREVEIGVLYDEYEPMAIALRDAIRLQGLKAELNQPYSGKPPSGLIYSAGSHGRSQAVPYVELEIRQDLLATPQGIADISAKLIEPLRALVPSAP